MKKFILFLFITPLFTFAQEKGIQFEHNSTWQNVKEKAKAENKYIFVDCYTTWCGPCIYMAQNIFPQEKVGTFFNTNFVSLKLQMDQTPKDNEEVKSWYEEAKRFETDYAVQAYPTFLIFNPEGELVHKIVGGGEADEFIESAKTGLNPETQYFTLVKQYEDNPNDAQIAKKTAKVALAAYDNDLMERAVSTFLATTSTDELLTVDNIDFIKSVLRSSSSPLYSIVRDNKDKVNSLLSEKNSPVDAEELLAAILMEEMVYPMIFNPSNGEVDFKAIQQEVEMAHPYVDLSDNMIQGKAFYFLYQKNWTALKDAANEWMMIDSKNKITPSTLNQFAWLIFENCDDPACLESALLWSRKSLDDGDNAAFLDTYANLLYKTGDIENAILWEEKALGVAPEMAKSQFQETLDKMKAGTPTWK